MGEREELDDGTATERGRLASYAKHQLTLSESANINNSLYYQPDLEDFSNYRITDDVQLSSSITEKLSLSVKLTYLFNSQPPVGVKKTDWIYSTGLKYAF
jgi:putative salt-induced outer membrane protein YdiY